MIKSHPFLTQEDLNKILNSPVKSHPIHRFKFNVLFQLLWDSGARISELCNLKIEDFDSKENLLTLTNTKNGEDRFIPVTESTKNNLLKLTAGKKTGYIFTGRQDMPMDRMTAYKVLKLRLVTAGITKNVRLHTFRHRFITDKLNKGAVLPAVQKFVGHKNLSSTGIYYHFTPDDLRKVLNV